MVTRTAPRAEAHYGFKEPTIATKAGQIQYQELYPAWSKPIFDEIDTVLARHYGFAEEELGFIINHDIKCGMGCGAEGEKA